MNIGKITYVKYDDNVLLDKNFRIAELLIIILNDTDFIRFEIFDKNGNLLLSTYCSDVKEKAVYLKIVKVRKEQEITGTVYDAYKIPSLIHKIKVRWDVDGAKFKVKKLAVEYADRKNRREALKIEQFINR